jgi:S-methylmethionine-dependent homocysteine/selenocysteine methylase
MSPQCAESYHLAQVQAFQRTRVDLVTAITMTYPDEAVGIANAAAAMGLPVVVSFTVETDGRLPTGVSLPEAIAQVDREARVAPVYSEFGEQHRAVGELLPNLKVIGGCCGTDHRDIAEVAKRVASRHAVSQARRSMRLSDLWQKQPPRHQKSLS